MIRNRAIPVYVYYILAAFSFWNWIYTMAIASDIPIEIAPKQFWPAEISVIIIFFLHIFLAFRGNNASNMIVILFPNLLWPFTFFQDIQYRYHFYSTILSTSMMICMVVVIIVNLRVLHVRKNKIRDGD